jgi:arylsulfatase A-like enzyme
VIDLADLTREAHVPGLSLATHWDDLGGIRNGSALVAEVERAIRPDAHTPIRFGPMRAILDGQFHYIRRGDGLEELYAYRIDKAETRNLSDTPEGQRELARLRALLATLPAY